MFISEALCLFMSLALASSDFQHFKFFQPQEPKTSSNPLKTTIKLTCLLSTLSQIHPHEGIVLYFAGI